LPAEADEYSVGNYKITAVPAHDGATVEYSLTSVPNGKINHVTIDDNDYVEVRTSGNAVGLLRIKVTNEDRSNTYTVAITVKP
jgi:hypothetical protein